MIFNFSPENIYLAKTNVFISCFLNNIFTVCYVRDSHDRCNRSVSWTEETENMGYNVYLYCFLHNWSSIDMSGKHHIYTYVWMQYNSETRLWRGVLDTTLCDKVCQ